MEKENKKKKTTAKRNKDQYKKGKVGASARNTASKKTAAVKKAPEKAETKAKEVEKKTPAKKVEEKKVEPKKVEPKKVEKKEPVKAEPKKPAKVVEPEIKIKEEEYEEKTIIFDGKDRDNLRNVVDKLEEDTIITKDKIVRRNPINKYIIYALICLIFITIIGTTIYVAANELHRKTNEQTINSDIYKKVSKNSKNSKIEVTEVTEKEEQYPHFKTLTLSEFEGKILKKEPMTVLISSQTCMGCLIFEPDLEEALAKANKTIYRLNITNWSEEERNRLRTYYHFNETPAMFVVDKNGRVTKDSSSIKDDEDALLAWAIENV